MNPANSSSKVDPQDLNTARVLVFQCIASVLWPHPLSSCAENLMASCGIPPAQLDPLHYGKSLRLTSAHWFHNLSYLRLLPLDKATSFLEKSRLLWVMECPFEAVFLKVKVCFTRIPLLLLLSLTYTRRFSFKPNSFPRGIIYRSPS